MLERADSSARRNPDRGTRGGRVVVDYRQGQEMDSSSSGRSSLRRSPQAGFRRPSPVKAGAGPYLDGGTGTSPAVLYNPVVYPSGARTVLGEPGVGGGPAFSRLVGYASPVGFNTNRRGNTEAASTGADIVATGSSWAGLEAYFAQYMPSAGTATAVPHVGPYWDEGIY